MFDAEIFQIHISELTSASKCRKIVLFYFLNYFFLFIFIKDLNKYVDNSNIYPICEGKINYLSECNKHGNINFFNLFIYIIIMLSVLRCLKICREVSESECDKV